MPGSDAPLPSGGSTNSIPTQTFEFSQGNAKDARESASLRRWGRLAGLVWLAVAVVLLVLGPSTALGHSSTFLPVVILLLILGASFLAISYLRAGQTVLSATLDDVGVQLVMSRPPNWSLRWSEPGVWVDISRGYQKGSAQETRSNGWLFWAPKFSTTVDFEFGRALVASARVKGFRVVDQTTGAREGRWELQFISIDHPQNPVRHPHPLRR